MTTEKVSREKRDCPPIGRKYFKPADAHRVTYIITPPAGTPLERILKRDYWTNVAPVLTPHAKIEVMPQDGEYYVELLVVAFGKNWADVVMHGRPTYLDTSKPVPDNSEYTITYRGPIARWSVIRKSDKEVIKGDFQSPAVAKQWLEQHEKLGD